MSVFILFIINTFFMSEGAFAHNYSSEWLWFCFGPFFNHLHFFFFSSIYTLVVVVEWA